jgi:RNA polymerase sigma-70 factor (ECF subfamily)
VHEPTDGDLIRASLEDPSRFEPVFDRHYDVVRRYAQRRVGPSAGEEIASKAFLLAFERRSSFRPSGSAHGSARAWLLGIATNMIRHHVRDERTHLRILSTMPPERPGSAPDDDARLDSIGVRPTLARELASLPRRERDAFLLLVLGELSYGEIAEALEIPVGTVRSRIHRARARLREQLRAVEAIPDADEGSEGSGDG